MSKLSKYFTISEDGEVGIAVVQLKFEKDIIVGHVMEKSFECKR